MRTDGPRRGPGAIVGIDCPGCGRRGTPAVRIEQGASALTDQPRNQRTHGLLICFHCGKRLRDEALPPASRLEVGDLTVAGPGAEKIAAVEQHDGQAGFCTAVGTILFHCPRCDSQQATGTAYRLDEYLFAILLCWRTSWVICHCCGARLYSRVDAARLPEMSPAESRAVIRPYVPLIARTLTVVSLLLFYTPLLGILLGLAALVANWRVPSGWRTWGKVGLILAIIAHAAGGVMIALGN